MITSESVRQIRRDTVAMAPDFLSRHDLYRIRAMYVLSLKVLEIEIAETEEQMQKPDIQNLNVTQLAIVTGRALFALLLPSLGLAALAGLAAGVATTVYRMFTNLF